MVKSFEDIYLQSMEDNIFITFLFGHNKDPIEGPDLYTNEEDFKKDLRNNLHIKICLLETLSYFKHNGAL